MSKRSRRYDESDARVRAPRSKPRRSKDRPDYSDSPIAFVTTVDRGRIACILQGFNIANQVSGASGLEITEMKARELGKNAVVVGDYIRLDGDVSGARELLLALLKLSLARTSYRALWMMLAHLRKLLQQMWTN